MLIAAELYKSTIDPKDQPLNTDGENTHKVCLRDIKIIVLKFWVIDKEFGEKIVVVNGRLIIISDIVYTRIGGVGEANSSRALHCMYHCDKTV